MGKLQDKNYYDDQTRRTMVAQAYRFAYKPPWPKQARWPQRFEIYYRMIKDCGKPIVDLGCGPGLFAAYIWHRGYKSHYAGIDVSRVATATARFRNAEEGHQNCTFVTLDIDDAGIQNSMRVLTLDSLVVCTEALEHIEHDVELLEAIPSGTSCLISVPRFDDPSHVRYFKDPESVPKRYGHLFESTRVTKVLKHWLAFYEVRK